MKLLTITYIIPIKSFTNLYYSFFKHISIHKKTLKRLIKKRFNVFMHYRLSKILNFMMAPLYVWYYAF